MDPGTWFLIFCVVSFVLLMFWSSFTSGFDPGKIFIPGKPREPVSPMTTETDSSPSAVTPAPDQNVIEEFEPVSHSQTTIPGAQRVDPTPMTDRQLWEQIEYNTRMSADVLHRMWVLVVISMVLSVIGGIAMSAFQ